MAEATKYTLTKKNSLKDIKGNVIAIKGQVIDKKTYDGLIERHKAYFESGVKKLAKETQADKFQNEQIESLEARVIELEDKVEELYSPSQKAGASIDVDKTKSEGDAKKAAPKTEDSKK